MFNTSAFEEKLATSWLGRSFFFFQELESTNTYAKQMSRVDTLHGALILTDTQFKGRGQYERNWEAEPGSNLTFSLVFEPSGQNRLTLLSLSCALAVTDVFSELAGQEFCLKWPNDILSGGKKVGGVLTEAIYNGNVLDRVVVGMGLNILQTEFSQDIKDSATSLALLETEVRSREELLASLLMRIEYYYRLWATHESDLIRFINRKLLGFGKWTTITVGGEEREGEFKFLGVNQKGELIVLNKDLEVDTFSYEQVRIRLN